MFSPQPATVEMAESPAAVRCCHHWIIQPATGPVSQGECQKCHEIREFENFVERKDWGDRREENLPETAIPAEEFADAEF